MMVYICTKCHGNILNGIRVIERTQKVNGRTDGCPDRRTDRQPEGRMDRGHDIIRPVFDGRIRRGKRDIWGIIFRDGANEGSQNMFSRSNKKKMSLNYLFPLLSEAQIHRKLASSQLDMTDPSTEIILYYYNKQLSAFVPVNMNYW